MQFVLDSKSFQYIGVDGWYVECASFFKNNDNPTLSVCFIGTSLSRENTALPSVMKRTVAPLLTQFLPTVRRRRWLPRGRIIPFATMHVSCGQEACAGAPWTKRNAEAHV